MFTKITKEILSNQAAVSQFLKTTLTHLRIPVQTALSSTLLFKKPSSLKIPAQVPPIPGYFFKKSAFSFHQPVARFGFAQGFKPASKSTTEQEGALSKVSSFQPETMEAVKPPLPDNVNFNTEGGIELMGRLRQLIQQRQRRR